MKQINKNLQAMLLICLLWLTSSALQAQTTVSGNVTDENGEPLISATVKIEGSTKGTVTDINGDFTISGSTAPFNLEISYVGYKTQTVIVNSATTALNVSLDPDNLLGETVVVSASRAAEKIQDAPASISVVDAKTIANQPTNNPILAIQNENGVQLDRQGANRINITMRGQAGLFGTSAFVMMDYRSLVGAGINTFAAQQSPISNLDIETVEVVRGPGGALYGPGVTTGVVHFITKDPFRHPGAAVEVAYGELNTIKMAGRYAWHNDPGTFGFKIVAQYQRSDEWTFDENDPIDAANLAQIRGVNAAGVETGVDVRDPRTGEVTREDVRNLQNYNENWSVLGAVEFRPNADTKINVNGSLVRSDGLFWQTLGEGRNNTIDYHGQVRLQWKGLFAQVFYAANDQIGDDLNDYNFLYRNDNLSFINREQFEAQVQYTFDIAAINTQMTVGIESRNTYSDSETVVYGLNEDDDNFNIHGSYFQSKTALLDKLDLVLAARFDYYNHLEQSSFAPRAGLVYKINPKHTVRFTYNKAYAPNSALENNIDFLLTSSPPAFDIWLTGNKRELTFDGSIRTLDGNLLPAGSTPNLQEAFVIYANYLTAIGIFPAAQNPAAFAAVVPTTDLNYSNIDPTTGNPFNPGNNPASDLREEDTFEIGYKGIFANKLSVSLDVYNIRRRNFVGVRPITPAPADATLAAQFLGLAPNISAALQGGLGLDAATAAATAQQVLGGMATFAGIYNGAVGIFPHSELPAPGTRTTNGFPVVGFGYPQFGDINYFGVDLGLKYFIRPDLNIFYNHSWLSQTIFTSVDQGEAPNSTPPYNLQMPPNRIRAGISYEPETGLFANAQYQFQEQFFSDVGSVFIGDVEERHLFNAAVGYNFDFGLSVILDAQNVFNQEYRTYANFPEIGRRTTLTARFTF